MAKSKNSRGAFFIVTYLITVIVLISGLLLPITVNGVNFNLMPLMQLGGALATFGVPLKLGIELTEVYSYPVSLFGTNFDLGAALLIFYALTAVLALILFIPTVLVKKNTARKIIFSSELIALTALLPLSVLELLRNSGDWNLNIVVPFCFTLLIIIIQSAVHVRKPVIIKVVLFLLSAVAVLAAAINIAAIFPALATPLQTIANALNGPGPFNTGIGLYVIDGKDVYGSTLFGSVFANDLTFGSGGNLGIIIAGWLGFAAVAIVCINLFFDMLGIVKTTNGFMLVCNLIRYILELLLIAALAAILPFITGSYGVMLYLLAAIAILQFIIQIIRAAKYKKQLAMIEADEAEDEDADIPDSDEEYAFDPVPTEVAVAAVPCSEPVIETRNVVYKVNNIYNGPTDDFIRKLSDDQKIEFARLFLEKHTGDIAGIPDYVVGGDNSRFFSMLFIYFSRVRDLVTDGLMNKFYEEVKLM